MSNENNQLQVLPKQQMNIQEMQSMAKLFAESGMFTDSLSDNSVLFRHPTKHNTLKNIV